MNQSKHTNANASHARLLENRYSVFQNTTRSADKVDSDKVDLLKSRLVQKLNTEVKFSAAAANFVDFYMHRNAFIIYKPFIYIMYLYS